LKVKARQMTTQILYTLRGHESDVVELLENHYPGKEVGQAFLSRAIRFALSDAQESCDFTHRHG